MLEKAGGWQHSNNSTQGCGVAPQNWRAGASLRCLFSLNKAISNDRDTPHPQRPVAHGARCTRGNGGLRGAQRRGRYCAAYAKERAGAAIQQGTGCDTNRVPPPGPRQNTRAAGPQGVCVSEVHQRRAVHPRARGTAARLAAEWRRQRDRHDHGAGSGRLLRGAARGQRHRHRTRPGHCRCRSHEHGPACA